MERYSMFLGRKNQYCENDYTTKCNLQINEIPIKLPMAFSLELEKKNGVAIIVNRRVQNAVFGCNLKNDRMISVCFQGKPFNITAIQVYAPNQ